MSDAGAKDRVKVPNVTLYTMPVLPSCRRVGLFLAERDIEVETVPIAVLEGEHKKPEFMEKNMDGRVPVLKLADGTFISESDAIAAYLDESAPGGASSLFGRSREEKAHVAMWNRRVECEFVQPMVQCARYGPLSEVLGWPKTENIENEARRAAGKFLPILDQEIAGKAFVNGKELCQADLTLFTLVDFGRKMCSLEIPVELKEVHRWLAAMESRKSVKEVKGMGDA